MQMNHQTKQDQEASVADLLPWTRFIDQDWSGGALPCANTYFPGRVFTYDRQKNRWGTAVATYSYPEANTRPAPRGPLPAYFEYELKQLLEDALLGSLAETPDLLLKLIEDSCGPELLASLAQVTVSGLIPQYHESGCYKDVYKCSLLVFLQDNDHYTVLPVALKIGKSADAICDRELAYHRAIANAPASNPFISPLYADYKTERRTESIPAHLPVTFERFFDGVEVGELLTGGHGNFVRSAIVECCLALFEGAEQSAEALRGQGFDCILDRRRKRVPFPTDINDRNFLLRTDAKAIFIDPGKNHPAHTLHDMLFRVIYYYFEDYGQLSDLAPLFEGVISKFGSTEGYRILMEFAATSLLCGEMSRNEVERALPSESSSRAGIDVDEIHDELLERVRVEGGLAASLSARRKRLISQRFTLSGHEYDEIRLGHAIVPVFLLSAEQMKSIGGATSRYLSNVSSDAYQPAESIRVQIRFSPPPIACTTYPAFNNPYIIHLALVTAALFRATPRPEEIKVSEAKFSKLINELAVELKSFEVKEPVQIAACSGILSEIRDLLRPLVRQAADTKPLCERWLLLLELIAKGVSSNERGQVSPSPDVWRSLCDTELSGLTSIYSKEFRPSPAIGEVITIAPERRENLREIAKAILQRIESFTGRAT